MANCLFVLAELLTTESIIFNLCFWSDKMVIAQSWTLSRDVPFNSLREKYKNLSEQANDCVRAHMHTPVFACMCVGERVWVCVC